MNLLAKLCNDEGFYYNHWIYIVPDEADDDELSAMQFGASSTSTHRMAACILAESAGRIEYHQPISKILNISLDFCIESHYNIIVSRTKRYKSHN